MAKKSSPAATPQPANLSPAQMKAAMAPLNRRIAELEAFDPNTVKDRSEPRIGTLEVAIDDTLTSVFGADTLDYRRYRAAKSLDTAGYSVYGTPLRDVIQGLHQGKERALALLRQIITSFEEKLADAGETDTGRALRAYEGLDLHPDIADAAGELYSDGHYANAIEDAVKALNARVRLRSGLELDGAPLMQKAFGGADPVLRFNDLADKSDQDEQTGFMMLFSGAVAGLRNPRAHKLIKDDPERALEFIAFVSLLAKLLDGAKKRRPAGDPAMSNAGG